MTLPSFLIVAASLQVAIAGLNLFLVPLLKWRNDLARMPLLLREVFQVHVWFISITLAIFGTMTFRFASEMAGGLDPASKWLAGCIGIFWAIRTVLQVTYYSSSHWKGQTDRMLVHFVLLLVYGSFAAAYLAASFGGAS